jgi:hypothetical protein
VRWQGVYHGIDSVWLRWQTLDGELLPTDKEVSEVQKQRAEAELKNNVLILSAEAEKQRAEK